MARTFIGLHYKAKVKRRPCRYTLRKSREGNLFDAKCLTLGDLTDKSELDWWLTERYCAYQIINGDMYRFNIHHKAWPLKKIKIKNIKINFSRNNFEITTKPDLQHFAHTQKVLLWGREKCG
jgi:uncharacterized protein YqjF (DUF2071 family)